MKRVGVCYPPDRRYLSYCHVPKDMSGWVDATQFLPANYDLCYVQVEGTHKHYSAWLTPFSWDGRLLPEDAKITRWKRNLDSIE